MESYCTLQVISPPGFLSFSTWVKLSTNKSNKWITNINSADFYYYSGPQQMVYKSCKLWNVATNYLWLSCMCRGWWLFSVCLCRLGSCGLCPLHTWGRICERLNYGAHSTPVCSTWALQQGIEVKTCHKTYMFSVIMRTWVCFWVVMVLLTVCLYCVRVCRHVTSVRTKAVRVKQPLEPVWPATNMAAGRPSMSHGEICSRHINLTETKEQIVSSALKLKTYTNGILLNIVKEQPF